MSALTSQPTSSGIGRFLATSLGSANRAIRSYTTRRRTVLSLSQLSDHDLKDIGLTRSEIVSIAYESPADRRHGLGYGRCC